MVDLGTGREVSLTQDAWLGYWMDRPLSWHIKMDVRASRHQYCSVLYLSD